MKRLFENRFGTVYAVFFVFMAVSTVTRTVLFLLSGRNVESTFGLIIKIFSIGFLFDVATFSYAIVPVVVYLALVPDRLYRHRLHNFILYGMSAVVSFFIIFVAFAEYFFWDEFGTRFNFIAVDYLVYTREVAGNIWESYPMPALLTAIVIVAGGAFVLIKHAITYASEHPGTRRCRLAGMFVLLSLPAMSYCFIDLSLVSISDNKFANSLAANGIYTFCEAFRHNSVDYYEFYQTEQDASVFNDLRHLTSRNNTLFADRSPDSLTIRRVVNKRPGNESKYNVILIMMESMSAKYFGVFGNQEHLTTNLDEIAHHGMLFKNIYATGNRTVRGMEAVMLSVPPTPGRSIVKRPHNENLHNIGSVFAVRDYENKFVYGGYGYFDNMNHFFGNNGFVIIDRKNFTDSEVTFENAWGVCDENLLDRVLKEADASRAAHKNFFSFVMTTSNHRPFTFPDGKVSLPAHIRKHRNRKRGVAYTDIAIGEFMRKARTKPWFDTTLFVIVADHCGSSAGKTDLPLENYRIPLIVYAPGLVEPAVIETLASQIDIGPTIFDLLNWQYESSFIGQTILATGPKQERAFIANYLDLGYLTGDTLTILKPRKIVSSFTVNPAANTVRANVQPRARYLSEAIAYYQGASFLYQQTMYSDRSHLHVADSQRQAPPG